MSKLPRITKIKISVTNPEKRVGAAFALIGFIGLYAFLLYVWAGNPPDLQALLAILLLIVGGLAIHRRTRDAPPPRAARLRRPLFGRKRKQAPQEEDEAEDEGEEGDEKEDGE